MSPVLPFFLGVALMGGEVGWRPLPGGGTEYVIRVSPEELADLQLGDIIAASDVPANVQPIKSFRIEVGRGPVERQVSEPTAASSLALNSPEPSAIADLHDAAPPGISPPSSAIPLVFTQPAGPGPMAGSAAGSPPDQNAEKTSNPAQDVGKTPPIEVDPQPGKGQDVQPQQNSGKAPPENEVNTGTSLMTTLALSGMTASFAAVVYIGWVAWEYRRKYLALLRSGFPVMPWEGQDDSATAAGPPIFPLERLNANAERCPNTEPDESPADPSKPFTT
ncbi:MAG: hypothetical protein ACUVTW_01495 [Thermogutta sp.]